MQCPKCQHSMRAIPDLPFSAQQCTNCLGVWLDDSDEDLARQAEEIQEHEGSIGAPNKNNSIKKIDCPKCGAKMLSMIHRTQFHIEYEACADCRGAYFDAGELSDLSEFTLVEQLTQLWDTLQTNLK